MPLLPTEPESGKSGNGTEAGIQEVSALEIANDSDPERAGRFRSLLESGDVDALAGEIADLIQTGIDAATLQQAMSE